MKVIIAGSRNGATINDVYQAVQNSGYKITSVSSGRARGVDLLGEQWARENCIPLNLYPAEWNLYGKAAGFVRNKLMADDADALIAVWDGKSRGTDNMIQTATKLNLHVHVYLLPEKE